MDSRRAFFGALWASAFAATAVAAEPGAPAELLASSAGPGAAAGPPGQEARARTATSGSGLAAGLDTGAIASAAGSSAGGGAAPAQPVVAPASPAAAGPAQKSSALKALADPSVGATRPYYLAGSIAYRQPLFLDDDPANDIVLSYRISAGYTVFSGGSVFAGLGLTQRFETNVPNNDSPAAAVFGRDGFTRKQFTLQDLAVGFNYAWSLPWAKLDLGEGSVDLTHRLSVFFPTSYASQQESLRVAPSLSNQARVAVSEDLSALVNLDLQYRFVRYAQLPSGAPATRFLPTLGAGLEYTVAQSERLGVFALGVDASVGWSFKYPYAVLEGPLPAGATASVDPAEEELTSVVPRYAWSGYAFYAPLPKLFITLAMGTGGNTSRDGQPNLRFFDQEDTELSLSVSGRY